jgi:hypothetical protein
MQAIKQWAIASVAVLALSVNNWGCGAADEADDLGQDQEALVNPVFPVGYGFVAQTGSACTATSQSCLIPADKQLRTNLVQLVGCSGSMWQTAFNASTVLFNNDAIGTGFHTATQFGNISLTPRCVAAGFGGSFLRLTPTNLGGPFQVGQKGYQAIVAANLELAGNDIVAHCQGAHLSQAQCIDFIRDQFRTLLNQAAGNRKNEPVLTSSDKANMTAYTISQ